MEIVLVGLPGSGKSSVGRRIAQRHRAQFVDLDSEIERAGGTTIPDIFATEGEAGFRKRERASIAALGRPDRSPQIRRVIATGGGAPVDPRNRWHLYRERLAIWLDLPPEVLAARLATSPNVRPLVDAADPIGSIRALREARARFYAAAHRFDGLSSAAILADAIDKLAQGRAARAQTRLLDADTRIGRFVIGDGIATAVIADSLQRIGAARAILLSEPGAWSAAGALIADGLAARGFVVEHLLLPQGEASKRLAVVETTARELARLHVERSDPIVAIGGGALGDTAGFVAATYLRGVPLIHVPTTLLAQIDSAIGGKTAVDLPEGKNLIGAFHQPTAVVIDIALIRSLPERERRAALGEAVKMAVVGDERLFELLESDGEAIANGDDAAVESGALAELVERTAWAKVDIVLADEREREGLSGGTGRFALNLGHSLGHAIEAAGGYADLLHGEAVAFGLRGACRLGVQLGVTPSGRAERIHALLDMLELGAGRLTYPAESVRVALEADKKHVGGQLHWVLPTADGIVVRSDVPAAAVDAAIDSLLEPSSAVAAR